MNGDPGGTCFHSGGGGIDSSAEGGDQLDVVLNMEGMEETALGGKQSDTSHLSPNTFTNTNIQVRYITPPSKYFCQHKYVET